MPPFSREFFTAILSSPVMFLAFAIPTFLLLFLVWALIFSTEERED